MKRNFRLLIQILLVSLGALGLTYWLVKDLGVKQVMVDLMIGLTVAVFLSIALYFINPRWFKDKSNSY